MHLLPKTIDMRITGKCNLNCDFCFGTQTQSEISLKQWIYLLDKFKTDGVSSLVITGGEPLLYPHVIELLESAKKREFKIVLSTNGLLFTDQVKDKILSQVDWISIPIDGRDYESYKRMRNISHDDYTSIFELLEYIKKNYPNIGVKIGTVVTRKNIYDIKDIFYQIKEYAHVWKLYQVAPTEKNKDVYKKIRVPLHLFRNVCSEITAEKTNIKIVQYESYKINKSYLFCEPNGDAVVRNSIKEKRIGNFITDYYKVLNSWHKYIDKKSLANNFNTTYTKLKEKLYGEY